MFLLFFSYSYSYSYSASAVLVLDAVCTSTSTSTSTIELKKSHLQSPEARVQLNNAAFKLLFQVAISICNLSAASRLFFSNNAALPGCLISMSKVGIICLMRSCPAVLASR